MKKLILLSGSYPYNNVFLDIEEEYFPKDVPIDVIPWQYDDRHSAHSLPENAVLSDLLWRPMPLALHLLYMTGELFSPRFRDDIARYRREGRLSLRCFAKALSYCAYSSWMFRLLEKKYRAELISEPEELVFYSFWLLHSASAAARLREKYGCHAVARANGGDLFEERSDCGRLPLRVYTIKNHDFISACSKDGQDYMIKKYGCGDITQAYLGTADYGARSIAPFSGRRSFVIVSCSNIIPLKRVELIAEALALIGGEEIDWHHFGSGELFDSVAEKASRLPPNVHAHLEGRLPHDKLIEWYATHDVHLFVSASTTETTPVSIMEALSFGIPVVATAAGGSGEAVKETHGTCIPIDIDAGQLARAIERFMHMDESEYMTFRANARAFWGSSFDAARNYAAFYDRLRRL